jgi:hypothetical protein
MKLLAKIIYVLSVTMAAGKNLTNTNYINKSELFELKCRITYDIVLMFYY